VFRDTTLPRRSFRARRLVQSGMPRLLAAVAVFVGVEAVQAQTIRGRVVDAATGDPIRQATVAVQADGRTVAGSLTDDGGEFVIVIPEEGGYNIRASAPGYLARDLDGLLAEGADELSLEDIQLEPDPVALEGINVEVRRDRGRMRGEDRVLLRQLRGEGTFVPGALLVLENPTSLTAYLAEVADLHVRYDFYGSPYLWSPVGPYHCLIAQVNHWPMVALGYRSLDDIALRRIAAIEIYNTAAEVPPEAQLIADTENPRHCPCGRCGLVNVWFWSSW
jgi:hypothetical protein